MEYDPVKLRGDGGTAFVVVLLTVLGVPPWLVSSNPMRAPPPAVNLPTRAQNVFDGSLPVVEKTYGPLRTAFPKTTFAVTLIVSVARACEVAVMVTICPGGGTSGAV